MDTSDPDGGFTLVELLVVVAILAVLAAIAIPVYSSQTQRARDAAASETLAQAVTALHGVHADAGAYDNGLYDWTELNDAAPQLAWGAAAGEPANARIWVCAGGDVIQTWSASSGWRFFIAKIIQSGPNAGTYYYQGFYDEEPDFAWPGCDDDVEPAAERNRGV